MTRNSDFFLAEHLKIFYNGSILMLPYCREFLFHYESHSVGTFQIYHKTPFCQWECLCFLPKSKQRPRNMRKTKRKGMNEHENSHFGHSSFLCFYIQVYNTLLNHMCPFTADVSLHQNNFVLWLQIQRLHFASRPVTLKYR